MSLPQVLIAQSIPAAAGGFRRGSAMDRAGWRREIGAVFRFPAAFRTPLEAAPFRLITLFVLFYSVMPGIGGDLELHAKYLFVALLLANFVLLAILRPRLNLSPWFPLPVLLISVLGAVSLAQTILANPGATFSSALIPFLVVALPLLIPTTAGRTDSATVRSYLFGIFIIAAFGHVFWQSVFGSDGNTIFDGRLGGLSAADGVVMVFLMLLAGLFRRRLLLCASILLIGVSLILRPTSTVAFTAMFAAAFIVLHRRISRRLLRLGCVCTAALIIIGNLAVLESADLADALYSVEPGVKEDIGGTDNNAFRLGVISAARDEIRQHSLLFGKAFAGSPIVDAGPYVGGQTGWSGDIWEPIHSDFITMIVEGGLVGYTLFAALFLGMALMCAKGARLARAADDRCAETLFDALQAINIMFMLAISGTPMLQFLQISLPFLMLVLLAIFLARTQPGFSTLSRIRPIPDDQTALR